MITVYAEKFSVGAKIAAALSDFEVNGKKVTMDNIDKVIESIQSPCKKKGYIEVSYNNEDYAITWGQGHMYGLYQAYDYDPEYAKWSNIPLPFFPSKYELKIRDGVDRATGKSTGKPDPWTKAQLNIVKQLFEASDYIVSATDDDREGQLIFSYVYEMLDVDVPYKRLSISSMTKQGLRDSFANLQDSSTVQNIENAGRGRNIADWVVGSNLTAAFTLKYSGGPLLSVGRVQTPTLAIICKREKDILNFKSHPFYTINAEFTTGTGEKYNGKHEAGQIEDKKAADDLLNKVKSNPDGIIESVEKEDAKKDVPFLYNLSALSMDANDKFGFTAQQTLDIAQELYMAGYLTYPRTKSQHLTDDMKPVADEILDMLATMPEYKPLIDGVSPRNYTKRHFDSSKVESHFAIIPTNAKPSGLSDNQKKIYDLCAKSLIRIIYKAATISKTTVITDVNGEKFKSTGSMIKDPQWIKVDGKDADSEEKIPLVEKGMKVSGEYTIKEGKTKPPERFTDKTLLKALITAGKEIEDEDLRNIMMEACKGGIGTEATRGSIIDTVVTRYCTRKGKSIIPSPIGMAVIDTLPVDALKSPVMTAELENTLNEVENGKRSLQSFIDNIQQSTREWCKIIMDSEADKKIGNAKGTEETTLVCPLCGSPIVKYSWGYACSQYDRKKEGSCHFAISKTISGAELSDSDIETIISGGQTRFMSSFKKKDGSGTFGAMLKLDENQKLTFTWNLPYNCPACGKPLSVSSKAWSCSGYKDGCTFAIWNTVAGKKLSDKDKEALLSKGKTKLISGFTSKTGKNFDAYLVLKDNKVSFEFPPAKKGGGKS